MAKGMALTLLLSISVVLISILFGTILALLRTYEKRAYGASWPASILKCSATPPIAVDSGLFYDLAYGTIVFRGGLALTLYTSAVIAEIVRGGLNSVAEGQFEAKSQGFTLIQTLILIVLPQCFKSIVPSPLIASHYDC